MIASKFMRV